MIVQRTIKRERKKEIPELKYKNYNNNYTLPINGELELGEEEKYFTG